MSDGSTKANSQRHCTRGLENFTPEGQALKKKHRKDAINTVLDDQEFQNEVGIPDPESVADLYFKETRFSRAAARVAGLADEEDVRSLALPVLPLKMPKAESLSRSSSIGCTERRGTGGLREVSSRAA
jgi:hypothetical protein